MPFVQMFIKYCEVFLQLTPSFILIYGAGETLQGAETPVFCK